MEMWNLILLSVSLYLPLALFLCLLLPRKWRCQPHQGLPPGPPAFPFVGNLVWLRRSFSEIESILRSLRDSYGPIVTLHIGSRPAIFVADRGLAHKILVQSGAAFADRPPASPIVRLLGPSERTINVTPYGPLWRVLRRNLTAEILHPSRVRHYGHAREKVLEILLGGLRRRAGDGDAVVAVESFQYAMFCLLVFMCFGEMLEEKAVREIEKAQRDFLLYVNKLNVFAFFPSIAKYFFRNRWRTIRELRQRQEDVLFPLIKARRDQLRNQGEKNRGENSFQYSYVDSLLNLEVDPDEKGQNQKLTDGEMVSLCSEFLNAGTDTTSTMLQWIMANLVKHQGVQAKLFEEIAAVVGEREEVREEDLGKLPYLKAVVMEGLRRHPPGHFVLPHAATEDAAVDGYVIPRNASMNFMVADINWDARVWEEPMQFRPERFLPGGEGVDVDITGSREIKMMPFGVGRRICPGMGLALLHLEYFVANLVWEFEWKAVDGEEVDLTEKQEFTVVMKNPLKARIIPRLR